MPDPFLLAHIVAPLQFDLSGTLTPISIRDQMLRGRLIVDRAVEQGLVGPRRDLLVVGAGAAGATAAIRAAQHGIRAVLLDRSPWPFLRQAGSTTRWVDPTQYDFPGEHWQQGRYPWRPPAMPLPWRRNFASNLTLHWSYQLAQVPRYYGRLLDVRCNATLARPYPFVLGGAPLLVQATWTEPTTGQQQRPFGMVLSAIGFGSERCDLGSYRGFRFWDADPFGRRDLGIPADKQPPRILISGGGDGALQDFLRITTGRPARKIYRALRAHPKLVPLFADVERQIYDAEDQATRAYIWSTRQHDCAIHSELHRQHERLIDNLRSSPEWSIVDAELSKLVIDPLPEITLVHQCDHFSQCYGLNRLLVLLIAKYLESNRQSPLRAGNRVTAVDASKTGTSHSCGNPSICHGEDHEVTIEEADCRGGKGQRSTQTANVVIIRHGVDPPAYIFGGTPVSNPHPRQVLPYHLVS
jgi:hypothetical protein